MAPINMKSNVVTERLANVRRSTMKDNARLQCLENLLSGNTKLTEIALKVAHIKKLSREEFIQNCVKWMHVCCSVEDYCDLKAAQINLKILIEESAEYSELNSPVTHFLRTKFFTKFLRSFRHLEESWMCVELCLKKYKGSCNAYQERLKQAVLSKIEKNILPAAITRVYAILPSIGEGGCDGISYSNKWKNQFEDILKCCNLILRNLFIDIIESQTYEDTTPNDESYHLKETTEECYLYTLFHNYSNILQFMLLSEFPAPKIIIPQKVLDVICRCLSVTSKTLGNLDTTRKIKLCNVLPKFHNCAMTVLKALIVTCKTHLLPYSHFIVKLINQTIHSTDIALPEECDIASWTLRVASYDTWRKWVISTNGAGAVDSAEIVFMALKDLNANTTSMITEATSATNYDKNVEPPKRFYYKSTLQISLCLSNLKVLQVFIREIGATLEVDKLKAIQKYVVSNILHIQRSCSLTLLYSTSEYRYELYRLLMELINCSSSWAAPVNWGLEFFKRGIYDPAFEVSSFCSAGLANMQNIVNQEVIRYVILENKEQH